MEQKKVLENQPRNAGNLPYKAHVQGSDDDQEHTEGFRRGRGNVERNEGERMARKEDEIMPEYVPLSGEKTIHAALDDEDGSLEEQERGPGEEGMDWEAEDDFIRAQLAKAVGGFPRGDIGRESPMGPHHGSARVHEASATLQEIEMEARNAKNNLGKRIEALKESKMYALQQLERSESSMQAASTNVASCEERLASLSEKYTYLQSLKQYMQALCSCLGSKAPLIEEVLEEAKIAHQERRGAVKEIRSAMQSATVAAGEAAVSHMMQCFANGTSLEAAKEAAALARREKLMTLLNPTHADSSTITLEKLYTDVRNGPKALDLKEVDSLWEKRLRDCHEASSTIFADTETIFSDLGVVLSRIADWKVQQEDSYFDAYMPLTLGRLLSPFVMSEMISWHPLDRTSQNLAFGIHSLNEMIWLNSLSTFPTANNRADDTDGTIVQQLVLQAVVPFLLFLVENCWDAMNWAENDALLSTVQELAALNKDPHSEIMHELLHAIFRQLHNTAENICVVSWPPMVLSHLVEEAELASGLYHGAIDFVQAVLKWREVLKGSNLFTLVMDNLILNKVVPHLRITFASPDDCLKRLSRLVDILPGDWLAGHHPATDTLQEICKSLQARMDMEQNAHEENAAICLRRIFAKLSAG